MGKLGAAAKSQIMPENGYPCINALRDVSSSAVFWRVAEDELITDIPALNVVGLLNGHRYWRRCHNAYVEDAWEDAGNLIPTAKWFCGETSSKGQRRRSYRHADGSAVWVDADGKWWVS